MEGRKEPWWQLMSDAAFRQHLTLMRTDEVQALSKEMGGILAAIQGQLEAAERGTDWYRRASIAKGLIAQRKSLVKREIILRTDSSQKDKTKIKAEQLELARKHLDAGDLASALRKVIDILDGSIYGSDPNDPRERYRNRGKNG